MEDSAKPTLGFKVKIMLKCEEAECIMVFYPDNTYIGDFGFDWVRKGDAIGLPGHHNDYMFRNHMGKHYKTATMKVENDGNRHGNAFKKDNPVTGAVDPKGEICGMLRILPNHPMYHHKIKVVLFKVITKINGGTTNNEGDTAKGKKRINEILGQALVNVDIEEGENNGYSWDTKHTVVFSTANNETASHELLHSLGLWHTFDGFSKNAPFTYKFQTTDNIMDYTHLISKTRKTLLYWHWQILNVKIR